MGGGDGIDIAGLEGMAAVGVLCRKSREIGRHGGIGQFGFRAGHHPHPWAAGIGQRREHGDIVEHDGIRVKLRQKLAERRLGLDDRIDDRLPGRRDIGLDLIDRVEPEMRQMPFHESLPVVLPLALGQPVVGGQLVFLETVVGEDTGKPGVTDEDGTGATRLQRLGDADAIQRGAETGFRKQGDGGTRAACHGTSVRPADGAEQGWRPATGRMRTLVARNTQMRAQKVGSDLKLAALEVIENTEMLVRGLPQPEDADARHRARQAPELEMAGERLGHEAIGRALRDHGVKLGVDRLEGADVEGRVR
jgi:hypothetical protein